MRLGGATLPPGLRPFGLVLAGGRATRMGGGTKTLHQVGGRSIYGRIVERLAAQCDGWAVNAPADARAWAAGADCILPDAIPGSIGPLAGILAGLQHLEHSGRAERFLLTVPSDAPFLPGDLASRLRVARETAGAATALAASGDRRHPATALWPASLRPALETAIAGGLRSVEAFHATVGFATATWATEPVDPFFNVNTPADLARADDLARLCGW